MTKVHPMTYIATMAGAAAVVLLSLALGLPPVAAAAGLVYCGVSNGLVAVGLLRRRASGYGWANTVTTIRSSFVALITTLVVASFAGQVPVPVLVGLSIPALALDAVDGWVARRTRSVSELGARYDMEVDAFLLLVLSAYVAQSLGVWVLAIGGMRYAFVVVGWLLPWFRATLPPRYWRKVVTAAQGIALTAAASGLTGALAAPIVVAALLLLAESFGRDVVWLVGHRAMAQTTPARSGQVQHPASSAASGADPASASASASEARLNPLPPA
jgi:phosphatidylglycerophosphate synthase